MRTLTVTLVPFSMTASTGCASSSRLTDVRGSMIRERRASFSTRSSMRAALRGHGGPVNANLDTFRAALAVPTDVETGEVAAVRIQPDDRVTALARLDAHPVLRRKGDTVP